MAVSFIGAAGGGPSSVSMPSHQAGDLIVCFQHGLSVVPTTPTGFTSVYNGGVVNRLQRVSYKVAASSSETVNPLANTTGAVVAVYRGAATFTVSDLASITGSSSTVAYYAVSGITNRYFVGFGAHRALDTSIETPPSGMVNRSASLTANDEVVCHDSNGVLSSWSSTNVAVGGTSNSWCTVVIGLATSSTVLPQTVSATTSSAATVNETTGKRLSASASVATSTVKAIGRLVAASSVAAAIMTRLSSKMVAASPASASSVTKGVAKHRSATVAAVLLAGALRVQTQIVSASAAASVAVSRSVNTAVDAAATALVAVGKSIATRISAEAAAGVTAAKALALNLRLLASGNSSMSLAIGKRVAATSTMAVVLAAGAFLNWLPLKVYRGGAWVLGKLRTYRGGEWVKPLIKRWHDGDWEEM